MADRQLEPPRVSTTFPDPPPFWKDFTPDKVSRLAALRGEHAKQGGTGVRIPSVPADLVNLQPPTEPTDGKWRVFGEDHDIKDELQSLEAAGIQRLAPPPTDMGEGKDGKHTDRAFELKKMAKSLLLNFLELVGTMGINPAQGGDKVKDLRTLLINFHHVLNEYRPHQARESLIALMQEQLDRKRSETAAIRGVVDKAKSVLEGLGSIEVPGGGPAGLETPVDTANGLNGADEADKGSAAFWAREAALWEGLDSECG